MKTLERVVNVMFYLFIGIVLGAFGGDAPGALGTAIGIAMAFSFLGMALSVVFSIAEAMNAPLKKIKDDERDE